MPQFGGELSRSAYIHLDGEISRSTTYKYICAREKKGGRSPPRAEGYHRTIGGEESGGERRRAEESGGERAARRERAGVAASRAEVRQGERSFVGGTIASRGSGFLLVEHPRTKPRQRRRRARQSGSRTEAPEAPGSPRRVAAQRALEMMPAGGRMPSPGGGGGGQGARREARDRARPGRSRPAQSCRARS
jgi:hypothetical protein